MFARHGRGAIEICFSEKGALAKKMIGKHCFRPINIIFKYLFLLKCSCKPVVYNLGSIKP